MTFESEVSREVRPPTQGWSNNPPSFLGCSSFSCARFHSLPPICHNADVRRRLVLLFKPSQSDYLETILFVPVTFSPLPCPPAILPTAFFGYDLTSRYSSSMSLAFCLQRVQRQSCPIRWQGFFFSTCWLSPPLEYGSSDPCPFRIPSALAYAVDPSPLAGVFLLPPAGASILTNIQGRPCTPTFFMV